MKKLIIAANLKRVRVLKYREAGDDPIEEDHLVEDLNGSGQEEVESIQEVVTDQAGRFARGARAGFETGMSYGEGHNLKSELERNAVKKIAARIDATLESAGRPPWILSAPLSILSKLETALPATALGTLDSRVGGDLTHCTLAEMEKRFLD